MDSDSVGSSASPPLRSRVCMIFRLMESDHEHHVYIVDIDESSFKIPPPCPDYSVGFADIDLSIFEEKTPDIVLVGFPPINVFALDSLLCFFPTDPSMEVFYLEVPKSLNRAVYGEDGGVMKKCRFNPRRVVYGKDCLNKAPLNLVSPKDFPTVIRYGTRFLVFSTTIMVGTSPDSPGEQLEIYHPFSEESLKDLPNLIIHTNISGDGYELYNLETKSFEPLYSYSCHERGLIRLTFLSYSLIGDAFVVRTDLGMFCLDLVNPTVKGWVGFLDGISPVPWHGVREIYVAQNGLKLEGTHVYRSEVDEEGLVMSRKLPSSFSPFQVREPWKFCDSAVTLLDGGGFNYPCSTSCVLQVQRQHGVGVGTYIILDVIRADLSRFENENDKEWAQIIHSFRFRTKTKSRCCRMLPICLA